MTNFWTLLRESVIIQGIITISLLGVCIYLWIVRVEIPPALSSLTTIAVGFFFGSKYSNLMTRTKGG
jgi:hypothetical protein